ncbi:MAG TPA: hypothetical protein DIC18_00370 [Clostridiales bacterium]|nr:hypothetical protein [Clostridiales bacterium]
MTDKDAAIAEIKKWLGLDNWQGIALEDEDGNPGLYIVYTGEGDEKTTIAKASAQAVLENALAKSLTNYFMEKYAAEKAASAEFNTGDITAYFDRIMDIFDTLTEQGVIAIDGDAGSVAIHVTPDVINMVTAAINGIFKTELPTDITDPEKANIDFNTTGYEGKLFIDVKYAGNTYSLLFDGSQDDSFVITFTLKLASGRTYTVVFDGESNVDTASGTKWTASVTVEIKNADGSSDTSTEVTLSNFHAEWGNNNEEEVGEIITFNKGLTAGGSIFNADGTGPATNLAGGLMKILNSEAIVDYVDSLGKFIIRQIVK